ncbi:MULTISPECIES: type II toxin-antitoxin system HipA family toxin [unclassified Isoptericola]|uniref:type II toxin-antitoxin system HipA family toxin n=1 Tax=unclassified Isoptericola TaxID=2623355 RepID=UPI0027127356|nr:MULTISPECIES: HipA domain-containing protein [unclassified Isoptericola]MDO8149565.1 HipA domain-containing protein [Isoptericola sp. b515]MDO8152499.1 HipA domain-containing protein [Isoptericola sp. b408]
MTASELDAWLYGSRVGRFSARDTGRGALRVELEWDAAAIDRWGYGSRVLSHLLPMDADAPPAPARVNAWLDGLMPEGRVRDHMAMDVGVDPDDPVGFFGAYGGDTVGALQFVAVGADLRSVDGDPVPLDESGVADLLRASIARAGGTARSQRLTSSLPGMEPKIGLVRDAGTWWRAAPDRPTTHILKVARDADSPTADLVDTEAAAIELARRIGLTTIQAHVETFEDVRCLVVSRYDRVPDAEAPGGLRRIHQEDAAQALGINTRDPERKFQHGRTIPSLRAIAQVLRDDGSRPDRLLALTTLNLALGNTDAHAKNISMLRRADGTVSLAPAYDISMHLHHEHASRVFAMDVAGTRDMDAITGTDLVDEGVAWGLPRRRAERVVTTTLDGLRTALGEVDRDAHPGVGEAAWRTVEACTDRLRADLR